MKPIDVIHQAAERAAERVREQRLVPPNSWSRLRLWWDRVSGAKKRRLQIASAFAQGFAEGYAHGVESARDVLLYAPSKTGRVVTRQRLH